MFKYFVLGILQGIFEWLPISSEGIVSLFGSFLIKGFNPVDIALFLHLGTLLACIFYFWKDLKEIIFLKNKTMFQFLAISTIVSLAIGFPLYKIVREMALGNFLLILVGFGLLFTAYFHQKKVFFELDFKRLALLSGILQGLAVIPGLSRSGATIFALSFSKLKPDEILKISYLMSIPVVLLSSLYLFLENKSIIVESWPALISSFIIGLLTLKILISFSKKINFSKFALLFAILCFLGAIINFIL
ncbi:MAG: undecaprenyl-diphosphate phosphatase [Patescibacteria group bacterium]|nr:undecaprenyl-diphosphate phosphatase [Patescibacteria group bacterium]